jgi:hypothetical protein
MSHFAVSIPGYFIAQEVASSPLLGGVTFAVDRISDFVIQQVWPEVQSNAQQLAMPVKVVASYLLASACGSEASLLLSYGLYALAKTMTNCTHLILSRDTLDKRLDTITLVACTSIAITTGVFLLANVAGAPLSFGESALVSGCIAHWISRSAPEPIENRLNTKIQY